MACALSRIQKIMLIIVIGQNWLILLAPNFFGDQLNDTIVKPGCVEHTQKEMPENSHHHPFDAIS